MDSLVIQITMWRDDDGVRARLSSDAGGESVVHVAASVDQLLAAVTDEVERWATTLEGGPPTSNV